MDPFAVRFGRTRAEHGPLVFGMDPSGRLLEEWGLGDSPDGLDRFVDIVVKAAVGAVGVVKPQSAFYERHGWRGVRSLARLVEGCQQAGLLVILDAKRGDVGSTNAAYAEAYLGEGAPIAADALTLTAYLGLGAMGDYFSRASAAGAGLFVVVRSSNPEGRGLQTAVGSGGQTVEQRLISDLAELNAKEGKGVGPFGAVFAPTHDPPEGIDLPGMHGLYLAPGIGAQGATPADVARCFEACPDRVLPAASRSLLSAGPDPVKLAEHISSFAVEVHATLGK